jgi:hypothetical protein
MLQKEYVLNQLRTFNVHDCKYMISINSGQAHHVTESESKVLFVSMSMLVLAKYATPF